MRWQRAASRFMGEMAWGFRARRGPRSGARILIYHAVGTRLENDNYGISIDRVRFNEHLRAIAEDPNLEVVGLDRALTDPTGTKVVMTFDDGYLDTLRTAAPVLQDFGMPFAVFVTTDFLDRGPEFLTTQDLRELASLGGVTIGSHGVTHALLTKCDDQELRRELVCSKKQLETALDQRVETISYPHGDVDARVRAAALEAGYRIGLGSRFDINHPGRDPMLLCRCEIVAQDDARVLQQKVYGAWDWYRRRHPDVELEQIDR